MAANSVLYCKIVLICCNKQYTSLVRRRLSVCPSASGWRANYQLKQRSELGSGAQCSLGLQLVRRQHNMSALGRHTFSSSRSNFMKEIPQDPSCTPFFKSAYRPSIKTVSSVPMPYAYTLLQY